MLRLRFVLGHFHYQEVRITCTTLFDEIFCSLFELELTYDEGKKCRGGANIRMRDLLICTT